MHANLRRVVGEHQLDALVVRAQIVERAGDDGLARLWESADTLPTPAEVDAPGLWLARIGFIDEDLELPEDFEIPDDLSDL
jgi:uncharacterized protein (DUF2342 family)